MKTRKGGNLREKMCRDLELFREGSFAKPTTSKALVVATRANQYSQRPRSNAHGHYDVAIARGFVRDGAELAGGLFVFQFEADGAVGGSGEEIEKILRIETDGDCVALEILFDYFFGFAVFGAGG